MNRKILILMAGTLVLLCILFPNQVSEGAKLGLTLWFDTVLPALLPFMILSGFMIRQNITGSISRLVYPFFHKIFGVTREGCYPAVIGMLSGYPVGAKTAAQLYIQRRISKEEAQYLLSFCNNASPMFLLEYIGVQCLKMQHPLLILITVYASAFINALWYRKGRKFPEQKKAYQKQENENFIISLDAGILDAFITITKIGGYIILFSIFAKMIEDILQFSVIIKYIGTGILEITTGGAIIAKWDVALPVKRFILICLCAFGGCSSIAQTASVLSQTDLSVGTYVRQKVSQTIIIALLSLFVIRL
ncbi:MAG: nucleoside recognition domain-containing protein [Butyribacter sp.]|nr:nucleoside recognition domain-containing protein [bacterium]MDY3854761.1 nucleoside recognition domain-containing protein [Butyribacter sp.]